jgi:hypothetical protein
MTATLPRESADTATAIAFGAVRHAPPNEFGRERLARRTLRSMLEAQSSRQVRAAAPPTR